MIGSGDVPSTGPLHGDPFIERVRRALDHDLRTPLGTIVNYATILEYPTDAKPDDVRVFAGRIRSNAVRIARMLRHVADALILAERAPAPVEVDLSALVRALLTEISHPVRFPARGAEPTGAILLDRDLLAFAWRAFLVVNAEAGAKHPLDLDIEVQRTETHTSVEMYVGARSTSPPSRVRSAKFAEEASDFLPPESCFALGLAEELIRRRGAEFGLWGRPGKAAGLGLAFPVAG